MLQVFRFGVVFFIWMVPTLLLFIHDDFYVWMRDTIGFYYLPVIGANLLALANLTSKGQATGASLFFVLATTVALAAAWVVSFPLTVAVPITLGGASIVHFITRAGQSH